MVDRSHEMLVKCFFLVATRAGKFVSWFAINPSSALLRAWLLAAHGMTAEAAVTQLLRLSCGPVGTEDVGESPRRCSGSLNEMHEVFGPAVVLAGFK